MGTSRAGSDATRIVRRNVGSFTRLRRVREPKALPRSLANVPGPLVRADKGQSCTARLVDIPIIGETRRSEEHTSELQSLMRISYAVFCLKKKNKHTYKKQKEKISHHKIT